MAYSICAAGAAFCIAGSFNLDGPGVAALALFEGQVRATHIALLNQVLTNHSVSERSKPSEFWRIITATETGQSSKFSVFMHVHTDGADITHLWSMSTKKSALPSLVIKRLLTSVG